MICRYCENEVTPDSRLAHLQCCAECAAVDEQDRRRKSRAERT